MIDASAPLLLPLHYAGYQPVPQHLAEAEDVQNVRRTDTAVSTAVIGEVFIRVVHDKPRAVLPAELRRALQLWPAHQCAWNMPKQYQGLPM